MNETTVASAVQKMSGHMAMLYYFLTKAMLEDYGPGAKETVRRAIREFGLARGRAIRDAVLAAGDELTIENLDRYYDIPIGEGWTNSSRYTADAKYNTTQTCTFAEVWNALNWQEIGQIYCLVDTAIREGYCEGTNLRLSYTTDKNLMKGDGCCTSVTRKLPDTD